jgi:hypothetical protein
MVLGAGEPVLYYEKNFASRKFKIWILLYKIYRDLGALLLYQKISAPPPYTLQRDKKLIFSLRKDIKIFA